MQKHLIPIEHGATAEDECSPVPDPDVTDAKIHTLRSRLLELRSCLLLPARCTSLYVGDEIACGLPLQTIDTVVQNLKSNPRPLFVWLKHRLQVKSTEQDLNMNLL